VFVRDLQVRFTCIDKDGRMAERWILEDRFNIIPDSARSGGTATVYKSIDIDTGDNFAVKIFDKGLVSQELTREAFNRELKCLSDLNTHPNIGKLISFGDDPNTGQPYIVLEWLEESLLKVIAKEPIRDWGHYYTNYGRPLLDALSFAHRRDVVHRDVKPDNILFTESGELRLVDFGISKFKSYWGGGKTFQDWKSRPYATPEDGSYEYIDTKDVFGFAALSLACLENRDLDASEEGKLIRLLEEQDVDDGIISILSECLSETPGDRPASIDTLIDALDRLIAPDTSAVGEGLYNFHLSLTNTAFQRLQLSMGAQDRGTIEDRVLQDLKEVFSFGRHPQNREKYQLIGASHEYLLVIEESGHRYFVVVGVRNVEPWRLESKRQDALTFDANFHISRAHAASNVRGETLKILETLDTWEDSAEERLEETIKRRTEASWRSLLRLQFELERNARDEIEYESFNLDENRISFKVEKGEYQGLVGQIRILWVPNSRKSFSITFTAVESDRIFARIDYANEEDIPLKGSLSIDNSLQLSSLKRQESALDDVLFDRSARSDLRSLLFNPAISKPPKPIRVERYFQEDLDEAKRTIVEAALGSQDFLVINGPPGTGKTKLIAEMTLQYLSKNPGHKILISSQTHNALDNALEKVREVAGNDLDLSAVRVARKDDPRVSTSIKDLTLDNLVDVWLNSVKKNSSEYLDSWVEKNNVKRADVELGLAAGRLRSSLADYNRNQEQRLSLEKELNSVEEALLHLQKQPTEGDKIGLLTFNRDKSIQNIRLAEQDVVSARRRYRQVQEDVSNSVGDDAEIFSDMTESDLQEWENSYLSESDDHKKCKEIIELLQDWYERFGRSTDFYASFLTDSKVVAATCVGIGLRTYKDIEFDLCIIDEASKATPTETLLPLSKARKWILVGDPAQLPPYVDQAAKDPRLLEKFDLNEDSLKSTLLNDLIERLPDEAKLSLGTQYRMCPPIGNLVSTCFYNGNLKTGRQLEIDFKKYLCVPSSVTWYCTSNRKDKLEARAGRSFINRSEANQIETLVKRFNFAASQLNRVFSVSLLSFYSAQVDVLKHLSNRLLADCENLKLTVDTVDAFQGREADICIISMTRCNRQQALGFLDDENRINVALSRGRDALVIVGDSSFFDRGGTEKPISRVIEYIREHKDECSLEFLQ
jgi:superfamily I DNA and/or RNA helicase